MTAEERPSLDPGADPEVTATLRALPRRQASPGFTEAVLTAAAQPPAEPSWPRSMALLAASLVLATVFTAGALERAHQRQELHGRVDALRVEHQQLERELAEIRRLSAEQPAVVYLGGNDQVDVVWSAPTQPPSNGAAAPAATVRN
jgi:hypothetical protein